MLCGTWSYKPLLNPGVKAKPRLLSALPSSGNPYQSQARGARLIRAATVSPAMCLGPAVLSCLCWDKMSSRRELQVGLKEEEICL